MDTNGKALCGLCRYALKDESLVQDHLVKSEISRAFNENRCYVFFPDVSVIDEIKNGVSADNLKDRFIAIKNAVFDEMAQNDNTIKERLQNDIRLSSRIQSAVYYIHKALAESDLSTLKDRRFVIVKERQGWPTIYYISPETVVFAHVGQGPFWKEISSIYLGLKTFDTIDAAVKRGDMSLFESFKTVLKVEERAIETGYSHPEVFPPETGRAINSLVDAVVEQSMALEVSIKEEPEQKEEKAFTEKQRDSIIKQLDARLASDMMNFDYEKNIKAIETLERLAKGYKKTGDHRSLREVVRLLVSASGHDIHEIRNRANIILERVFAPKEYDAPLASVFFNISTGTRHLFEFDMPGEKGNFAVRIYRNSAKNEIFVETDMDYVEYDLVYDEKKQRYTAQVLFEKYGHYDFLVISPKLKKDEWITMHGTSGRINVLPDLRGELILEIFTDIHGHTRLYWQDENGHPGLVYNENGEVIRLGRFSDIAMHLEDIKSRYCITAIYLLGVQKRGSHREDWAAGASSPSPFSPMSLVEIEPTLGGEQEFHDMVEKAHSLDIKIIVDVIPHVNRHSREVPDDSVVFCYDGGGQLVSRSSTDGRFGSWDDGKLLNYRRFEVWEWLTNSVLTLIEKFNVDGIRFDSAHSVPIMMKKNNFPFIYDTKRTSEEMIEGRIIVNDREDEHFITTGYYDSQCRDTIAIPFHYFMMLSVERKLRQLGKTFFINLAECYWGHERFLSRSGIVSYNSSLFKICENIMHGKSDVREVYHIYDNYFPSVLPQGSEMLGILGNHDERRAMNTFGHRGLRAAVGLTSAMNNVIMDFEGSAEGEGWKVFLDNIFVNWNQFEYAAHRSVERFYIDMYKFHRKARGKGYLVWANNNMVAATMKFTEKDVWIGAYNFADSNQTASIQFDNPILPIDENAYFKVTDPLYSPITGHYSYFTGKELKVSRINTVISFTERVKMLRLEQLLGTDIEKHYNDFLKDSLLRLCSISHSGSFTSNFAFCEITRQCESYDMLISFVKKTLIPLFWNDLRYFLELGLKRAFYNMYSNKIRDGKEILLYLDRLSKESDEIVSQLGKKLKEHHKHGAIVFMSAEADPFSKSGGLANVVYELPRELVKQGEEVYVITGLYRFGDDKATKKMQDNLHKYNIKYTGINVKFRILGDEFTVGVHSGVVEGITYYLLDHFELFDGLYWGGYI